MIKTKIRFNVFLCMMLTLVCIVSCTNQKKDEKSKAGKDLIDENRGNFELYSMNASQYGTRYREKFVLLQNRMGIRLEYCIDRSSLQLWISPQAGKSMDYHDRNFSNRDDHCNLFDKIKFPDLNFSDYDSCIYDPFHSIIVYKNQKLHIAHIFDQPVVLIWFEKDGSIDLKSDRTDNIISRTSDRFIIDHPERGKTLDFVAMMGKGEGTFRHQLEIENGRSTYARANLKANQILIIAGEEKKENGADRLARKTGHSLPI